MTVTAVDLPMPDGGTCDALLARPDGDDLSPLPGVLLIMDAVGLRPQIATMAARVANWGYAVLAPNTFWRAGRQPLMPVELRAADRRDERMAVMGPLMGSLTGERWASDGPAYLDALDARTPVTDDPTRIVGYCMGGRLGVALAAAEPDRVAVVAGFHPGGLVTPGADSPHLRLATVRARLHFGYADADASMPAEAQQIFAEAAAAAGCHLTADLYAGAAHGFTMADLPAYSPEADARHWRELEAVFAAGQSPSSWR